MKSASTLLVALAGLVQLGASQSVVGKAEGFASGVTGGGDATPDHPETIEELTELLTDDQARVIVLSKEFDYTESEGTETGNVCASWGDGSSCQKIIQDDCGDKPGSQATWYKAPTSPIDVGSDKTIIGVGDKGVIKGKGLRMRDGATNIIIQNIQVTDLNPEYVWGGDAISFDGADLVWVDHVTTARPGRQHYVFGFSPSKRITLSNNFIDGESPYSTGCDGYHYWTFEMVAALPSAAGTLLHAVNNVWEENNGHALEGAPSADSTAECELALGRACEVNVLDNSQGDFDFTDTSFFSDYSGLEIAPATSAEEAKTSVPQNAGAGKIDTSVSSSVASEEEATEEKSTEPADTTAKSSAKPSSEPQATASKAAEPEEEEAEPEETKSEASGSVALYGQCGGQGYTGSTTCAKGKCVKSNDWYSQCVE
ncbi:hypothetical protein NM208_g2895 [Fusarium decemcellulare]|uniref:Uncharacterized protein n=1 Tax=Fusarium decemcellulare TaxID=57161 RepID=A0ACC1SR55_9HYPO|nr:hypothetical protein NM208_g2895 [Fusarium decemcellulare]